ncbi:MerR family transcriptional regulator [Lacticaseibacillus brantae]|uniref:Transcriptional regulator n=1 Tax=Lacticaseibacillus brantae DSM 23927 TaxID=1423727 RepID=A0A0R2B3F4_9LACO|nr:transcriptional regulator [Lacticaseibacillus brantae DSM 23927]
MKQLDISLGIGETSRVTGATTTQIRYWEKKGLVASIRHEDGGNKRFTLKNIAIISMVKMMMDEGYTLAKASEVIQQRAHNMDIFHTILQTRLGDMVSEAGLTELNFGPIENDPDFDAVIRVADGDAKIYKVKR